MKFKKQFQIYIELGDNFYLTKNYVKALEYFNDALKLFPSSAYCNYTKALILDNLSRYNEAKEYYKKAEYLQNLEIDKPGNKKTNTNNIIYLNFKKKNHLIK